MADKTESRSEDAISSAVNLSDDSGQAVGRASSHEGSGIDETSTDELNKDRNMSVESSNVDLGSNIAEPTSGDNDQLKSESIEAQRQDVDGKWPNQGANDLPKNMQRRQVPESGNDQVKGETSSEKTADDADKKTANLDNSNSSKNIQEEQVPQNMTDKGKMEASKISDEKENKTVEGQCDKNVLKNGKISDDDAHDRLSSCHDDSESDEGKANDDNSEEKNFRNDDMTGHDSAVSDESSQGSVNEIDSGNCIGDKTDKLSSEKMREGDCSDTEVDRVEVPAANGEMDDNLRRNEAKMSREPNARKEESEKLQSEEISNSSEQSADQDNCNNHLKETETSQNECGSENKIGASDGTSETLTEKASDDVRIEFMPTKHNHGITNGKTDTVIEFTDIPLEDANVNREQAEVSDPKKKGSKYKDTMKTLIPFRPKINKSKSPLDQIGLFSYITFHWMNRIIYLAYKNKLTLEKILPASPKDAAITNAIRLERSWNEELEKKGVAKASFNSAVFRFARTRLVVSMITQLIWPIAFITTTGVIIRSILHYLEEPEPDLMHGLLLVLGLFITESSRILALSAYLATGVRTGVRTRTAVTTMIYRKLIRLRSLQDKTVGELVNLCTNDAQRYYELMLLLPLASSVLLLGVLDIAYAVFLIGPAALLGALTTFFVFVPMQGMAGKLGQVIRQKSIIVTDKRVRLMNEILNCIKLIKMYAWEIPFSKTIKGIRKDERKLLEKAASIQSIGQSLSPMVPNIATVLTIIIHLLLGNDLTAAKAFTLVSVLNTLRIVVGYVPRMMRTLADTSVAKHRIKELLLMEELKSLTVPPNNKNHAVVIKNATFAWDRQQDNGKERDKNRNRKGSGKKHEEKKREQSLSERNGDVAIDGTNGSYKPYSDVMENGGLGNVKPGNQENLVETLSRIDISLPKGELLGVCGGVGSGKSSLISAILSQMRLVDGEIAVGGTTAYAAQQAWIFNATLKDNILFDKPFDKAKYNKVIHAACLDKDIKMLLNGDQTEIGEKGINLSGGQKQRVSLARALYADCDVYLLDDPLSAVDAHVGQHIFQHYILEALHDKTVLFVTHQLQYLNQCDKVLFLKDGRMEEYGTHQELMSHDKEYAGLIRTFHAEQETKEVEEKVEQEENYFQRQISRQISSASITSRASFISHTSEEMLETDGALIVAEEKESGSVKLSTYNAFIKAAGGCLKIFLLFFLFILNGGILAGNTMWLSYWINQGSGNTSITVNNQTVISDSMLHNPNFDIYTIVYGVSILCGILIGFLRCIAFMKTCLTASSKLHDTVFVKVMRSPMSFFDTTPTGRILNRFSIDMDELDVWLPLTLELSLQNLALLLFAILTICVVFPWFLVALVLLIVLFLLCVKFFRAGIRESKRLDNVTRSPWVSLLTSSIQGLSTIHAYEKADDFINRFGKLVENNSVAYMTAMMCGRWIQIRLDALTMFVIVVTASLAVLSHGQISAAIAGLALSYTIQVAGLLQLCVNMSAEAEARFTSVERMNHYIKNLEEEAPAKIKGHQPAADWPMEGRLQYKHYKMRYRNGLPFVIKGITLNIKPKEKIGIVGRTGSGKSTLGVALFRLVEASEGEILIDGVDISQIGLHDLRSKLSIIPQDPVLFVGTIRYNLDPFNEHSDEELWSALEKTYMKNSISALEKQLEAPVVENGENFSVGERQLICMARALLRNSKILMLDEATAAIDTETDALIQETIRNAFKDCTMLTIAHRLNTVLACDRVLVMEDGKVGEFDKPETLLANPRSRFSAMMAASEDKNSETDDDDEEDD